MDNLPDPLVPATDELARRLARRLSPEHRREIAETSGLSAEDAVRHSVASSVEAYAFVRSGEPVFLFGVEAAGLATGTAMLWMLATTDISRYGASTLRACRRGLGRAFLITGAHCLEQYIPEWYRVGVAFARRLGFQTVRCPFPDRPGGRPGTALLRVTLERADFSNGKQRRRHWDR